MALVPPYIDALSPYEAGRRSEDVKQAYGLDRVIKLASNENPLGASPLAIEALRNAMRDLHIYPNGGLDLRRVLAETYETKMENVVVGSGSDAIMANIIRTFLCDEDEVMTTEAAFIGFQVLARSRGVKYRTVPYRDWRYDLPALGGGNQRAYEDHLSGESQQSDRHDLHAAGVRGVLPACARTGPDHTGRSLLRIRQGQSALSRLDALPVRQRDHVADILESVWLGRCSNRYGFAHERLIRNVLKVKLPFEPSTLAQAAAIGALADKEFVHRSLELNARTLRRLTAGMTESGSAGDPIRCELRHVDSWRREAGVRTGRATPAAGNRYSSAAGVRTSRLCARITGTDDQMDACLASVSESAAYAKRPRRETLSRP